MYKIYFCFYFHQNESDACSGVDVIVGF